MDQARPRSRVRGRTVLAVAKAVAAHAKVISNAHLATIVKGRAAPVPAGAAAFDEVVAAVAVHAAPRVGTVRVVVHAARHTAAVAAVQTATHPIRGSDTATAAIAAVI